MKKLYETEWQNIKFESFAIVSDKKLADEDFYTKFYEVFFKKYSSYEEIDENWRASKRIGAKFILEQIRERERECLV